MRDLPKLVDAILPHSTDLIDQLDQHIKPAVVTPGMNLADPKVQITLAEQAARRGLVDDLLTFRRRAQEKTNGR